MEDVAARERYRPVERLDTVAADATTPRRQARTGVDGRDAEAAASRQFQSHRRVRNSAARTGDTSGALRTAVDAADRKIRQRPGNSAESSPYSCCTSRTIVVESCPMHPNDRRAKTERRWLILNRHSRLNCDCSKSPGASLRKRNRSVACSTENTARTEVPRLGTRLNRSEPSVAAAAAAYRAQRPRARRLSDTGRSHPHEPEPDSWLSLVSRALETCPSNTDPSDGAS